MGYSYKRRIDASLVSTRLLEVFSRGEKHGKIHSHFENATNLEMEDGYIFNLLPEKSSPNPRSLILPETEWAVYVHHLPSVGEEVLVREKRLEILDRGLNVEFGATESWNPLPSLPGRPLKIGEIRINLDLLQEVLCADMRHGGKESLFAERLYHLFEAIEYKALSKDSRKLFRDRISKASEELLFHIGNGQFVNVLRDIDKLVGMGPGLTPSGDDVLTGVMGAGAFYSLAFPAMSFEIRSLNSQIAERAFKRTTVFGQIMLSDASRGEVVQSLGVLLQTLLCRKEDGSLPKKAREVMALGESSGKDMLSGVILGVSAYISLGQKASKAMHQREE